MGLKKFSGLHVRHDVGVIIRTRAIVLNVPLADA